MKEITVALCNGQTPRWETREAMNIVLESSNQWSHFMEEILKKMESILFMAPIIYETPLDCNRSI